MSQARTFHSATLLPSGKVLVVGGFAGTSTMTSVESYDPGSDSWSPAAPLQSTHYNHTATLLPSGRLLVAAGAGASGVESTMRVYDPGANTWSVAGFQTDDRVFHTATLLPSGKVLLVGGTGQFGPKSSAEIYDASAGSWPAAGAMATARGSQTATLLPSGNVLVAGGWDGQSLAGAEIYDRATNAWTATGSMIDSRRRHTATLLSSGKVLVAAGDGRYGPFANAELYDPTSGFWTVTGSLADARVDHTATLLSSGKVLVAGGRDLEGRALSGAEIFDPAAGVWTKTAPMLSPRSRHSATLLPSGKVLVAGGWTDGPLLGAEIYDPATDTWSEGGSMNDTRAGHTATLLPSGKVLVVAGEGSVGPSITGEVYDPSTDYWTFTSFLAEARIGHAATLLLSGEVLVAGGNNVEGKALASVEVYDPLTNTWSISYPLNFERAAASATVLPSGHVLVTGGDARGAISNAELYDEGRDFLDAWRPIVATTTSPAFLGGDLSVFGSGFTGVSEASGGNGMASSPTNHPVLQLRNVESGRTTFAPLSAGSAWTDVSFRSQVPVDFDPGYALATVFVNGIPSVSKVVLLVGPEALPPCPRDVVQFAATSQTITEGDSATLTITRSGGCGGAAFSVTCGPIQNTAGPSDFSQLGAVVPFAPNQLTAEFPVSALGDLEVEGAESFMVRLAIRSGDVELGPASVAVVTIEDDDVAGTFGFGESHYPRRDTLVEGGAVSVVVNRKSGSGTASVRWTAVNGTASGGALQDFDGPGALSGVLVFDDDDKSKAIELTTRDDAAAEGSESFSVTLSSMSPGTVLGPVRQTVVTITDNDVPADTSAHENDGEGGPTRYFFSDGVYSVDESSPEAFVTIVRSDATRNETVKVFTSNASATSPQDYTRVNQLSIQFPAGTVSVQVPIGLTPESGNADEGFQYFNVRLNDPSAGARLGQQRNAVVIIQDDDMAGSVAFSSAVYEEGESGGALTITLMRTGGLAGTVSVRCTTEAGVASAGADFGAVNTRVTFADGQSSATLAIPILDDPTREGNEPFNLTLREPHGNAALGAGLRAVVTIVDDDAQP
jgi:hypothetical protein